MGAIDSRTASLESGDNQALAEFVVEELRKKGLVATGE